MDIAAESSNGQGQAAGLLLKRARGTLRAQASAETGRPALSDRLPRAWLFPLAVFAGAWLLILAAWHGSDAIYGQHHRWTWHFLFMDTGFYRGIAHYGYTGDPARGAFFPLFPLLIRLVTFLTGGDYIVGGLIASIGSGAASVLAVWALADRVAGRRVADRAAMLFSVFPGAMTFALMYSEPLAVALGAAALLALLNRRWLPAGIIGALGTAEHPTLVVLAAVFGLAALQAIWTRREWRALLAPALTPLGVASFFLFLKLRYHHFTYWFRIEKKGWRQRFDWGAHTFRELLWRRPGEADHKLFVVMVTVMVIVGVAGVALTLAARLPFPVVLFGVLTLALVFTSSDTYAKPRFVWTAFPIFIGAAAKLPRVLYWPVLALSAAGFVFLVGWWRHVFPAIPP